MRAYMYLGESHWGEGSGLPGDAEMTGQRRHRGVVIAERIGGPTGPLAPSALPEAARSDAAR